MKATRAAVGLRPVQEDALNWRDLQRGLQLLPEEQRSVILLVSVEDLSYAQAAQVLGVPVGTVMSPAGAWPRAAAPARRPGPAHRCGGRSDARASPAPAFPNPQGEGAFAAMSDSPIPEDDLHAYVDGQLPPERGDAVARQLQEQSQAAEDAAAFAAQRDALRAAFAHIATEPVPPRLHLQNLIADRASSERRTVWRAAAAVLLALSWSGGGGGWALHARFGGAPNDLSMLAQEAIANHVVYTADRKRPTELGAEQRDDLARWVSNRLGRPVAPPDMSSAGFRYMGGRLAATPQGPAGQPMFRTRRGRGPPVFVLPMRDAPDTASACRRCGGDGRLRMDRQGRRLHRGGARCRRRAAPVWPRTCAGSFMGTLAHELRKAGLSVAQQHRATVRYNDIIVGRMRR